MVEVMLHFTDTRCYRTIFVEEMSKDYVRTARAKGCDVT